MDLTAGVVDYQALRDKLRIQVWPLPLTATEAQEEARR